METSGKTEKVYRVKRYVVCTQTVLASGKDVMGALADALRPHRWADEAPEVPPFAVAKEWSNPLRDVKIAGDSDKLEMLGKIGGRFDGDGFVRVPGIQSIKQITPE